MQELPELYSGNQPQDPFLYRLMKEGKIRGLLGDFTDYEIGARKIKAEAQLNNLLLNGTLGYNGNWGLQAQHPAFGGMLRFNANENDGNRSYGMQFQRAF